MPTIFTHPAVSLGLAPWLRRIPASCVLLGAVLSIVPDLDVISFKLGIPYTHPLGHRGFTHSIVFALLVSICAALAARRVSGSPVSLSALVPFFFVSIASHGLLDAMTTGGEGVGFFIPISNHRYFFPFRPIRVSPIGAGPFVARAAAVLGSELRWVWLPLAVVAVMGLAARRVKERRE